MPIIHDMKINLPVIFIEENNQVTAHTPALDLATCGKDIDQAKKRFEEILVLFLKNYVKWVPLKMFCWNAAGGKSAKHLPVGNPRG